METSRHNLPFFEAVFTPGIFVLFLNILAGILFRKRGFFVHFLLLVK